MPRITSLPQMSAPDGDDEVAIVDQSVTTTKRMSLTQIKTWLQTVTSWITTSMIDDEAITKDKVDYTSVDVYSTSEVDTGKIWVDGRPIYRKVLTGNVTLVSGIANIAHGITGLTTDWQIINMGGGVKLGTTLGTTIQSLWYREAATHFANPVSFTSTNIEYRGTYPWGSSKYTIVLEYVK